MKRATGAAGYTTTRLHASTGYQHANLPGNTTPTLPVAGAVAWWDATQITGAADNSALSSWPDMSGNTHNLAQATGGNKPTYFKTTSAQLLNGKPAVTFVAANFSFMNNTDAGLALAQPYTIMAVAKWATTAGVLFLCCAQSAAPSIQSNGTNIIFTGGSGIVLGTVNTTAHYLAAVYSGAASQGQYDGTNTGTVSAGAIALTGGFRLGISNAGAQPFNGIVGEVAIWPSALTTGNLSTLHAYCQTKWAVT